MCNSAASPPYMRKLEDEIYQLRTVMEQVYLEEASFNSEVVIEISRKLDLKINEYMKHRFK
nr:aspartyl-phosphate phosphatase Spo0E family protein [Paenibacillus sabuli]